MIDPSEIRDTDLASFDEEYWTETYKPIKNPYSNFDYKLFHTEGESAEIVRETAPLDRVWTWVDGEEGSNDLIVNGYYPEYAKGYYITQKQFLPTQQITIELDEGQV